MEKTSAAAPSDAPRLWLVRHGQTDWNVQHRIQGHTPTDLNETGRQQAARLADVFGRLSFQAIWSSDLPRARHTAEIIARRLSLAVETSPALRERELGVFEGKNWDEIRTMRGAIDEAATPASGDLADWTGVPGVETDAQLWDRVQGQLLKISVAQPRGDILIVTHGGVIKHSVCHILGIPPHTPRRFPLANGITAIVQRRADYFYLLSLADVDLLAGRESPADTSAALAAPSA